MTKNNVVEEIRTIIEWYRSLPMDYTGISDLMYQRIQLATLLSYFATDMGDCRLSWKESEAEHEKIKRTKIKEYIDAGLPISKASEIGKYYSIEAYGIERQLDGLYYSMKLFYDTTNNILDALNQHISNLKREQMALKTTQT